MKGAPPRDTKDMDLHNKVDTLAQFREAPGPSVNSDTLANLLSSKALPHHHAIVCAIPFIKFNFKHVGNHTNPNRTSKSVPPAGEV